MRSEIDCRSAGCLLFLMFMKFDFVLVDLGRSAVQWTRNILGDEDAQIFFVEVLLLERALEYSHVQVRRQ